MATGPKIVHKQFNSPMGLYSQQNIKETLGKHMQNLGNGAVGIDFSDPTTGKPGNLANSAVLRMLEEEERNQRGYPGQRKVVWPPVPESNGYHQPAQQVSPKAPAYYNAPHSPQQRSQQSQDIPIPVQHYSTQKNQPSYHYQAPTNQFTSSQNQYPGSNYGNQYQNQSTNYQNQEDSYQPSYCEGLRQETCGLSKLIPVGPGATASPSSSYRPSPSPGNYRQPQSNRWAPVSSPLSPQTYGSQPSYPSQSFSPQPQYPPQQYSPAPEYYQPQRTFEPPPSTITLRQQQPIHQKPAPIYSAQPVAASFKGGVNMRGDSKWPPQQVREAVAAENEARRQLAKGPACRPRKINKDYSSFFAQNMLNNNYPGYRAPPGTQHYEDHPGRSSY